MSTITLLPSDLTYCWERWDYPDRQAGYEVGGSPHTKVRSGQILVGFNHAIDEYGVVTEIYRGLVKFDLTGIQGHVVGARLRLSMCNSWCMHDGHVSDNPVSPLRCIALASEDWIHGTDHLVSGVQYLAVPPGNNRGSGDDVAPTSTAEIHAGVASGCTFTLDVTTAVRDWIASRLSNQGFVLSSGDGRGNVESNDYVIATYGDFHLEVDCLPT